MAVATRHHHFGRANGVEESLAAMRGAIAALGESLEDALAAIANDRRARTTRELLTPAEFAEQIGRHPNRVYQMVARGELQRVPATGRSYRIPASEIDRLVER